MGGGVYHEINQLTSSSTVESSFFLLMMIVVVVIRITKNVSIISIARVAVLTHK